ncbi:PREDICTED: uncharacterized protein LOC105565385 [Vollenhovia emeryi]|uniref:uncharacterized protein LOC105565385 n=1 Tax=Vollenhovia emeryi TaxID=411798 RepID=UPI0005F4E66C|nr:PREDICTED: uncharacterized protein LOC105565385 [Vollenhovia emeryi]
MSHGTQTSVQFSSASHVHQDAATTTTPTTPPTTPPGTTPPDEPPELARHFRTGNQRGIAACLDQLKSDSEHRKKLFERTDCLDILVQLLRSDNQRIVDRSLSVLADACMTDDVRKKVRNSKIGFNVVLIIENLESNAMLHCRACRLVGNLSECRWHAEKLCNAGVIKALVALLQSKTDEQTYCMAVRAVRNIWNAGSCGSYGSNGYYMQIDVRKTMLELEIIKLIAQLFVTAEKKSNVAKYDKLVNACLKAMCTFLIDYNKACGKQMCVSKDMCGYKCLMRCCSTGNKLAVKCLYVLCSIFECRLDLGISGAVEKLVALISTADANSSFLSEEIMHCLNLFCCDSVNRNRIQQGDGLQLIVTMLSKPEYERHHYTLLMGLSMFVYDEISLDILTKHGIVEVLVGKLTSVVAKNNERNKISRKRPSDSVIEDHYLVVEGKRPNKFPALCYNIDRRDDWSPRSATSGASSSSSPSTPPLPPYSDFNTEIDDLEDNIYSPVYSDKECDNEEEEAASPRSYKSLTVEADSDSWSPCHHNVQTSSQTESSEFYTLYMLNRLTLYTEPINKLAEATTIKGIMNYIKHTKKQYLKENAIKVLRRIMGNVVYFMPLLKQGCVFEVQTLPETREYTRYLRTVAETGGAIGQLSFTLLRGEEEQKLLTAVSIPLLIETKCTLKCLLKKYGGLQLIFRLLADSSNKLHKRAIWSICQLAKTLKIHSDDYSTAETATKVGELCDYPELPLQETSRTKSSMVTFELDDGTTIQACRRMLCQCSPVFSVMLEGNFSESSKKRIRLKNSSRKGLKTLILAASGGASIVYTFEKQSIESLLDAVLLADYFLMPDLVDTLTEKSINRLNHTNFYQAWRWARNHSCHEFRSYCVKSFLTAKMSWSETMQTFRDFYDVTNTFDEFLCEIRNIILDVLCQC